MCAPRCVAAEVATAPSRTGTTATTRAGSAGSSMPMRHPGEPGARVRQTMSPPAERHTSVSARAVNSRAARWTAQPFTTPLGSSTLTPAASAVVRRRHRRTRAGPARRAPSTSAHLGRTVLDADLAPSEPGDPGVLAVGAEVAVHLAQQVDGGRPGASRELVVDVPAAQGEGDRHAHDVLDAARRAAAGRGHRFAWSRALCSDWM